jgi:hypothetical protein
MSKRTQFRVPRIVWADAEARVTELERLWRYGVTRVVIRSEGRVAIR